MLRAVSESPGTLYVLIQKGGIERIHSYQPAAVRVYFGGRSLGLIFICAGFGTQSSSFFSLIPPKFTAPQRHREDSLKVEAAPYAIQVTDPRETKIIISSAYAGDHGLGRGGMRNSGWGLSGVFLACFGGFRCRADDPTKPWCLLTESFQRPLA